METLFFCLNICLSFCLSVKTLNIGLNFWIDKVFIFYMCIPIVKIFSWYQGQGQGHVNVNIKDHGHIFQTDYHWP